MKKYMKRRNPIFEYGKGVIGLSVASSALGTMNNDVASKGQGGLQNIAKFAPPVGTIIGAGLTIGALRELQKASEGFKRKRR